MSFCFVDIFILIVFFYFLNYLFNPLPLTPLPLDVPSSDGKSDGKGNCDPFHSVSLIRFCLYGRTMNRIVMLISFIFLTFSDVWSFVHVHIHMLKSTIHFLFRVYVCTYNDEKRSRFLFPADGISGIWPLKRFIIA